MARSATTTPNHQRPTHHRLTVNLPIQLAERLAIEAMRRQSTATDIVVNALERDLALDKMC
jgi:hypothetical protein